MNFKEVLSKAQGFILRLELLNGCRLVIILAVLLVIKLLVVFWIIEFHFDNERNIKIGSQKKYLEKRIVTISDSIDSKLKELVEVTDNLHNEFLETLEHETLSSDSIKNETLEVLDSITVKHYKRSVTSTKSFFGVGYNLDFGIKPEDSTKKSSLFIRASNFENPRIFKATPLNYKFWEGDEDADSSGWYHKILNNGHGVKDGEWVEPYYGTDAQTVLAEYGKAFYSADSSVHGIVYYDYSLYDIKKIVESSLDSLPPTVFGYVLSKDGKLIYHPNNSLWKRKNLLDISFFGQNQDDNCNLCMFSDYIHCLDENDDSPTVCEENKDFKKINEQDAQEYTFQNTEQKDFRVFKKIGVTDWYLVMIHPDFEIEISNSVKRKKRMVVIIVFILLELIVLSLALFTFYKKFTFYKTLTFYKKRPFISLLLNLSKLFTFCFLIDLVLICIFSYKFPNNINSYDDENSRHLKHEDIAHSITSKSLSPDSPDPLNFGIKIDVLSIRNAHELQIAGYYWMRNSRVSGKELKIGGDKEFVNLSESENKKENDTENKKAKNQADILTQNNIKVIYQSDSLKYEFLYKHPEQILVNNKDTLTYKGSSRSSNNEINIHKPNKYEEEKVMFQKASSKEIYFPDLMEHRTAHEFPIEVFINGEDTIYHRRFEAVLKQNFNYSKFPFDNQTIQIRIRHKDFWEKQFLIPDFGYTVNSSAENENTDGDKMGHSNNADLEEWQLEGIEYNFRTINFGKTPFVPRRHLYHDPEYCSYYNSAPTDTSALLGTFGDVEFINTYPELRLILEIKRQFFRPLIAFLLPVVVILILLFFYVLRIDTYSPGSFLDEGATLLFTLLLSHFALREFLPFKGMIFIEFFYFIVYVAIILYIINRNIYFDNKSKSSNGENLSILSRMVVWENNLISVVSFWPITILLFTLISILFFYS